MDFDLSRLDARNFEQLTQSLAQSAIGAHLSIFGDGPDGGREATWERPTGDPWAGYGVLQSKAKQDPGTPVSANLQWLKRQITAEAARWRDSTQERRNPDHYVLATNVKLSASPTSGIDDVTSHIHEQFLLAGYPISAITVWSYQEIRALLDNNLPVRTSYSAWILPGDIISKLYDDVQSQEAAAAASLTRYVASCLNRDLQLKLNQTGTVRDQPIGVAQVFIDVPFQIRFDNEIHDGSFESSANGIAEHLIRIADETPDRASTDDGGSRQKRLALVGGPGQGKSTVTQFLAQLYRSSFLIDSGTTLDNDTRRATHATFGRMSEINLPLPRGRRWPVRVVLPDLADALSSGATRSVLHHIAQDVSSKANASIDQNDLLRWLQAYPWIVMFDGLDEVPSSANRTELIEALRDFYSAARSVDADLVTISTTRPQGYDGEYGKVEHIDLAPLTQPVALEFADTFLDARNGAGSDINERTKKLLRQAIQQPATQRLFESPLQATILAILIERLGHAPGDRWRLFSSYYQVITQREQEKTGELSTLLQTYASEIDYLHRSVGRLLQERGEAEGGARGVLSRDELESLIQKRLLDIGHQPAEAVRLASDFMRLATERLVFLAMLTAETAGFEIRSMQEFMAAEQITQDFSDDETFSQLRIIAGLPYWSNVVRFAAGRIFATREMLKPIVLQLCQGLEAESNPLVVKRGRTLALEILSDGVVDTQPRYAVPLADHAARLFSSWDEELVPALARVANKKAQERFDDAARAAAKTGGVPAALAVIYAGVRQRSDPSFYPGPESIWDAQAESTKTEILRLAWISGNHTLREIAEQNSHNHEPSEFILSRRRLLPRIDQRENSLLSGWEALALLSRGSVPPKRRMRVLLNGTDVGVTASFVALEQNRHAWASILAADSQIGGWSYLHRVARLVQGGDKADLSEAIMAYRALRAGTHPEVATPWILEALLESASLRASAAGTAIAAELESIAKQALEGHFGDREHWLQIEEQMLERSDLEFEDLIESLRSAEVAIRSMPLLALRFTGSRSDLPNSDAIRLAVGQKVLSYSRDPELETYSPLIARLGLFFVSFMLGHNRSGAGTDDEPTLALPEEICTSLVATIPLLTSRPFSARWATWISALDSTQLLKLADAGLLDTIGANDEVILRANRRVAGLLFKYTDFNTVGLGYLWLVTRLDPSLAAGCAPLAAAIVPQSATEEAIGAVFALIAAPPQDIESGAFDDVISLVSARYTGRLGATIRSVLAEFARREPTSSTAAAICARIISRAMETDILLTKQFADVLEKQADYMGAEVSNWS